MPLMVMLACQHTLWPGSTAGYKVGETAYCKTCRTQVEIKSVGRTEW